MKPEKIGKLKRLLQEARYGIACLDEDFALPLYEMLYVAVRDISRMSTNGHCIYVNPDWLLKASPVSREVMLAHQMMHIALGHVNRPQYFLGDRYHLSCDIIANSRLRDLGYEYDALPGIGKLFHETFYPRIEGHSLTPEEAFRYVPFDPSTLTGTQKGNYLVDSELYWDRKSDRGECGIIVLSPADEDPDDLKRAQIDPGKKNRSRESKQRIMSAIIPEPGEEVEEGQKRKKPPSGQDEQELKSLLGSIRYIRLRSERSKAKESEDRHWQKPNDSSVDWRRLLDTFLQEEICDYSFLPPDRRLQDNDFFLPDYNEKTLNPKEVLFAVDTSGSVDDEMLDAVYGEIEGGIEQFNGSLNGVLAFFDTRVYGLHRFSDVEDLGCITPAGGGGTDFAALFGYLKHIGFDPACIVIFTDGKGEYPEEASTRNIPVLWLLSSDESAPPWGRRARFGRTN